MLRPSTPQDIDLLVPIVRASDALEILDSTGQTPREALEDGLERSDLYYSMFSNHSIVCMGGVAPSGYNPKVGIVWFLASDGLVRSAVALQFYMPTVLAEMHRLYPSLANFVDARNVVSAQWLQHLGFKLVGTHEEYGVGKKPFHWFVKGKHKCALPPWPQGS